MDAPFVNLSEKDLIHLSPGDEFILNVGKKWVKLKVLLLPEGRVYEVIGDGDSILQDSCQEGDPAPLSPNDTLKTK